MHQGNRGEGRYGGMGCCGLCRHFGDFSSFPDSFVGFGLFSEGGIDRGG